jgi:hypothetical protein
MISYYDAYTSRWIDYLDIITTCQQKGAIRIHDHPESLLLLSGTTTLDVLFAWYDEDDFFAPYD